MSRAPAASTSSDCGASRRSSSRGMSGRCVTEAREARGWRLPASSTNIPRTRPRPGDGSKSPWGEDRMTIVNAGGRLDRLPVSSFHRRIFWLIGAGMFFDGYDLYVGTTVLGAAVQSKFATLPQVPQFISLTFLGMTIGSLIAGFLGDRYGRRFTYQFNLMVFGLSSLAAAFAPNMETLIALRFIM